MRRWPAAGSSEPESSPFYAAWNLQMLALQLHTITTQRWGGKTTILMDLQQYFHWMISISPLQPLPPSSPALGFCLCLHQAWVRSIRLEQLSLTGTEPLILVSLDFVNVGRGKALAITLFSISIKTVKSSSSSFYHPTECISTALPVSLPPPPSRDLTSCLPAPGAQRGVGRCD